MPKINLLEVGAGYAAASGLNANAGIIQDAFENTLSRNGSVPNEMQANLDMNNYRVINVGLATNPRDAVPLEQMITLGSGFAGVASVGGINGVVVDPTNPSIPLVGLTTDTLDALNLANNAINKGEEVVIVNPNPLLPNARVLMGGIGVTIDNTIPGATVVSTGPVNHSTLLNLNADDHPQYPKKLGLETISGDWTFDNDLIVAAGNQALIGHDIPITGNTLEVIGDGSASLSQFSFDGEGAKLYFSKSQSNTPGTNIIVNNGDIVGDITGFGANGTSYDPAARIRFEIDGVPGAVGDMPGRITLWTTPDGAALLIERLRIASNGNITLYTHAASNTIYVGWSDALSIGGLEASLMANGTNMRVDHKVGVATTFQPATFAATGGINDMPAVYARVLTWTGAAPLTITGLVPAAPGQVLVICNSNTAVNNITLANEDAGSAAANRFALPNATNATIQRGGSARLWYNPLTSRWAAFGVS